MNEKAATRNTTIRDKTMTGIRQLLSEAVARNTGRTRYLNAPLSGNFLTDQPPPKLSHGQALKANELLQALAQIGKLVGSINEQIAVYNLPLKTLTGIYEGRLASEIRSILFDYRGQLRKKAPTLLEENAGKPIQPKPQTRKAS